MYRAGRKDFKQPLSWSQQNPDGDPQVCSCSFLARVEIHELSRNFFENLESWMHETVRIEEIEFDNRSKPSGTILHQGKLPTVEYRCFFELYGIVVKHRVGEQQHVR